jgi:hypothetical protein
LEERTDTTVAFGAAVLVEPDVLADFRVVGADPLALDLDNFDFGFDLRVAIWHSIASTTASCAATDASPAFGAGRGWPK